MSDVTVPVTIIPWEEITLGAKLGEGGFGIVYKGTWKHGGEVAIKQIKGTLGEDAEQEFKAEAGAMKSLDSPYIIRLFGICWEHDRYAMVMELMPNASLYHLLHTKQDLPWNLRYNIAKDIAYGLRLLHSRKILHRDLKSLNVLLDRDLRAKLTDFGLAKVKSHSKTTSKSIGSSSGTIAWMAPELFSLSPKYSEKSDTYAYGITAWELATREIPYQDVGDASIIKDAVKSGERADIPTDCPQTFADLIQSCWDRVPSKRPTMEQVVTALEQIITKEPGAPAPAASQLPQYQDASFATVGMVTQLPKPITQALTAATGRKYIAEYDYVSPVEKGLSFKKGDIINITNETGEWWIGELNGTTGWVPYNHVKLYVIPALATASPLEPAPTFLQMQALQQEFKTLREQVAREQAEKERAYQEMERLRQEFNKAFKPQVNPAELQTFLNHVVAGRQDEAEAMLTTQNPALVLVSGTITDHAQRTFLNITGFQYAVWALDWRMWRMIRKYLPPEEARLQAEGFATGPWVKEHGEHVNWQKLIENYQIYIDKFSKCEFSHWQLKVPGEFWVQQIGGEQRKLPMHVLQEYCQPSRAFEPVPNFRDEIVFVRKFPTEVILDEIGKRYSLERGTKRRMDSFYTHLIDNDLRASIFFFSRVKEIPDRLAVVQLYETRLQQRSELIAELRSGMKFPKP